MGTSGSSGAGGRPGAGDSYRQQLGGGPYLRPGCGGLGVDRAPPGGPGGGARAGGAGERVGGGGVRGAGGDAEAGGGAKGAERGVGEEGRFLGRGGVGEQGRGPPAPDPGTGR